tara:strand:- start:462 stop:812 length:351 start_codon:yes stop_codon:yes gene_type:complete
MVIFIEKFIFFLIFLIVVNLGFSQNNTGYQKKIECSTSFGSMSILTTYSLENGNLFWNGKPVTKIDSFENLKKDTKKNIFTFSDHNDKKYTIDFENNKRIVSVGNNAQVDLCKLIR